MKLRLAAALFACGGGLILAVPRLARSQDFDAAPPAWEVPFEPRARGSAAEAVRPDALDLVGLRSPLTRQARIPRGSFRMGSTPDESLLALTECTLEVHGQLCRRQDFETETPLRTIQLSAYRIDRHEVSMGDYERCVQARRCVPLPHFEGARRFARAPFPANLVSWEEARDYCAFVGGRLPTEAEWERAARGPERRRYPWGDQYNPRLSNHGRLAYDATDRTDGYLELAPVGAYPAGATPEQVFDLAGNVEEWTFDRYQPGYDPNDRRDPRGPDSADGAAPRSVRGGSYLSPAVRLRGAARSGDVPTSRSVARGFRCVHARPLRTR